MNEKTSRTTPLVIIALMLLSSIIFSPFVESALSASSTGTLSVNAGLPDVSVYISGLLNGTTDSGGRRTVSAVPEGVYTLKLTLPGYKNWTKQFNITASQTTTVYAYLERGTGESTVRNEMISYNSSVGVLKVNTGLDEVNVYVGGEFGGTTDDYYGGTVNGIVEGTYTLELSKPGYKQWTKQAKITEGKTTTVYAYLQTGTGVGATRSETISYDLQTGSMKMNTGLNDVGVFLDGEYGGLTDDYYGATTNGLIEGTYTVTLSKVGYKDWAKQLSIPSGKTTTIYAYLEPGSGSSLTRSELIAYNSPYGSLKVNTGLDDERFLWTASLGAQRTITTVPQ